MPSSAIDTAPVQTPAPAPAAAPSILHEIGFCLPAATIYVLGAKLSLILAFEQANTSAVWPASGLAIGVLVFAPLVILWSIPRRRWTRDERLEGIALLGVLVLVGQAICGIFLTGMLENWPSAYMVIPVLLWVAFRLGRCGAVAA